MLANPTRFETLAVIAEVQPVPEGAVSFSTLRDRVGMADSGQFNYHLDRLVGTYVRKTEEGYELRHAGRIAYRLAVSGLLTDRENVEVRSLETPCFDCGGDLVATTEGDRFRVGCADCGRRVSVGPFPPRAVEDYPPAALADAFDRYQSGMLVRAAHNVCPWCASSLEAQLESAGEGWPAVSALLFRFCDHCRAFVGTRVQDFVRFHPAVVAFYHDHGVDVLTRPVWELEHDLGDLDVRRNDGGWAATVRLSAGADTLELGLGEQLSLDDVEVI